MSAQRRSSADLKRRQAALDGIIVRTAPGRAPTCARLSSEGQILKAQLSELDYRFTIGSQVTWYPKSERWRIEVSGPLKMKAVFVKNSTLIGMTEVDSDDPEVVAGLVQIHRAAIEEAIEFAAKENWPDGLGILPQTFEVGSMAALKGNADFE